MNVYAAAAQNEIWFNKFNKFERDFIEDALAKTASGEWDSFDIISREKAYVFSWLDNSEKFQSYKYNSPGFGVMEDLKLALGSFLNEILTNKYFKERVSLYQKD